MKIKTCSFWFSLTNVQKIIIKKGDYKYYKYLINIYNLNKRLFKRFSLTNVQKIMFTKKL